MEIKSKSVKLFCAVVETGSLLAAANKIALSASAASRAITQLEERMGFELFDRSGKALSLTPEGMEFYRIAMEGMRVWNMIEDFPKTAHHARRRLRIAVLARHASDVIIPAVVTLMKAHEKTLQVTMDVHASRDIHYSKYSHPFDIGFGTLLSTHDDMTSTVIAHLPFRLIVNQENPLAQFTHVSRAEYADENFIVLSSDTPERKWSDCLLPDKEKAKLVAEVSSTQVALRFVKLGVGVHFTDKLAAQSVKKDCVALEIDDDLTIPFCVFWPRTTSELSPEIRECIALIASSIRAAGIDLTPEGEKFLMDAI